MAKIAKWSPTPHLHSRSSTQQIMYEFSAVLGVISLIAISVYGYTFGGAYALKAIWMLLVSIISAILTETIFF
ncbi:electron transporter RnfD, partial [Turicibacter sanguinis]|nr:electron transporter RnfD [Turicibacter sanguinis]